MAAGVLTMEKLTVFLGLIGAALCWAPQPVQDTPEVAAAKAAHLAALAKAKEDAIQNPSTDAKQNWRTDDETVKQAWKNQWADDNALEQWNEVAHTSQKEDDGSWKDDESWKNYDDGSWREHDTTQAPNANNEWSNVGEPKWKGPIALPPGYDESGAPLPVEDTPEVAAAKAKHLQAYVRAATKTAPAMKAIPVPKTVPQARNVLQSPLVRPALPNPPIRTALSNAPLVRPASPPSLQTHRVVPIEPAPIYELDAVGDTPEVAAAKAAHFAAHANRRI